ncbi:MAG: methyltransferase domain-containing protein, partial [Gammaproteobacteria bacterium]|nr:methyltransferase domain-containing protein [Gammaproteobacteria bacterium]
SLERAATAIKAAGLTDRITLKLIEPGPIPLSDDAFDIVVTKDVICHIPDKQSFFAEVFRVLRSGGIFASGDWIRGEEGSGTRVFNDWVEQLRGLKFHFETVRAYVQALESVGFTQIESRDHSDWSERIARQQLEDALGPARETSIQTLGKEGYKKRTALTRARLEALSNRDLQHWHLRASKP